MHAIGGSLYLLVDLIGMQWLCGGEDDFIAGRPDLRDPGRHNRHVRTVISDSLREATADVL